MEKSILNAAEKLLRRHGAETWVCSADGSEKAPAENWVVLSENHGNMEQQVRACTGAKKICVVTGNAGYAALVKAVLGGDSRGIRQECGDPRYTAGELDRCMREMGYGFVESAPCPEAEDVPGTDALIDRELDQVLGEQGRERFLIRLYEKMQTEEVSEPFLSVIIRTQGRRMEALEEALRCMAGQNDPDWEVLLMLHRVEAQAEERIRALVRAFPEEIQRKTRILPVRRQGRCAPVNEGILASRGAYFSVFDDDDLLLPDWVGHFREGSRQHPGSVIHQYAVSQEWESVACRDGNELRAVSGLNNQFCRPFDLMLQARANSCPLMTLAFPARLKALGIFFDETLDVCEDWEYLMRTSSFLGVTDVKETGAIYRMWVNAGNSHTVHDEAFWRATEKTIRERHNARPLLMPEGSVAHFVRLDRIVDGARYIFEPALYQDRGKGFTEADARHDRISMVLDDFALTYPVGPGVKRVRWDPVPGNTVAVKELRIEAVNAGGESREPVMEWTNARAFPEFWFFDLPDPQMVLQIPEDTVELRIRGRLQYLFTGSDMTVMRGRYGLTALKHMLKVRLHGLKERLRR